MIKKLIKVCTLTLAGMITIFTCLGYVEYKQAINQRPLDEMILEIENSEDYVSIDEISDYLITATVSVEDKRFYNHHGVDPVAYLRLGFVFLTTGDIMGGGSTITQQLAKNLYFTFNPSLIRKFAEFFMAKEIESKMDKDEILACYLNVINYGDNNIGIYDAAYHYFGKAPIDLNFDEATLLAGIPQSPANFQLSNHLEEARERQQKVLKTIEKNGYYNEEELSQLLSQIIY